MARKDDYVPPEYASEVPFAPTNWEDRDNLTGQILQIIEASVPEGKQQEAIKNLIKEATKKYYIDLFNDQFTYLTFNKEVLPKPGSREYYYEHIWYATGLSKPSK